MNLNLSSKHVLITGGSKGIGLACAAAFAEEGAHISLVSRDLATLKTAQEHLLAEFPTAQVAIFSADLIDDKAALMP